MIHIFTRPILLAGLLVYAPIARAQDNPDDAAFVVEQSLSEEGSDKKVSTKVIVAETEAQLKSAIKFLQSEIVNLRSLRPNFELDVLAVVSEGAANTVSIALVNQTAKRVVDSQALRSQGFMVQASVPAAISSLVFAQEIAQGVPEAAIFTAQIPGTPIYEVDSVSSLREEARISQNMRWTLTITMGVSNTSVRAMAMISQGANPLAALVAGGMTGLIEMGFQYNREAYIRWVNDVSLIRISGQPSGQITQTAKRFSISFLLLLGTQSASLALGVPVVPMGMLELMLTSGKYMATGIPWHNALSNLIHKNAEAPSKMRSILINTLPFALGMLSTAAVTFDMMGVRGVSTVSLGVSVSTGLVAWLWTSENNVFKSHAKAFVASICHPLGTASSIIQRLPKLGSGI